MTLEQLGQEFKAERSDGNQYSALFEHRRRWRRQLATSMGHTELNGFDEYAEIAAVQHEFQYQEYIKTEKCTKTGVLVHLLL